MFAVNVDRPTQLARIHEWPNGYPRFPHCNQPAKNVLHGEWEQFKRLDETLRFAQGTGLDVALCRLCRPVMT